MSLRWTLACCLGEAAGIAVVALAYAMVSRGLVPPVPAILAAGAWEGLALGLAQGWVLARAGVCTPCWALATAAVATLGYGLSLAAGAGAGPADAAPPPLALALAGAAALGAVLGALMGAAQWNTARGRLPFRRWTAASAAGWAAALPAIFAGAALVPDTAPLWQVAAIGALSGAAAGALLGALTAPALPRPLLPTPSILGG